MEPRIFHHRCSSACGDGCDGQGWYYRTTSGDVVGSFPSPGEAADSLNRVEANATPRTCVPKGDDEPPDAGVIPYSGCCCGDGFCSGCDEVEEEV